MARMIKMTQKKLEYLIKNYSSTRDSELSRKLGIDRKTIFYWKGVLKEHGIILLKDKKLPGYSSSRELIRKVKVELGDKVGMSRGFVSNKLGTKKSKMSRVSKASPHRTQPN